LESQIYIVHHTLTQLVIIAILGFKEKALAKKRRTVSEAKKIEVSIDINVASARGCVPKSELQAAGNW
jgi:adenylate cyclase class IV